MPVWISPLPFGFWKPSAPPFSSAPDASRSSVRVSCWLLPAPVLPDMLPMSPVPPAPMLPALLVPSLVIWSQERPCTSCLLSFVSIVLSVT